MLVIVDEGFSTLQRVEIAEIRCLPATRRVVEGFSTLQRVEIAEILPAPTRGFALPGFSTLQRVEIAEIVSCAPPTNRRCAVSVLFNESKLPKSR